MKPDLSPVSDIEVRNLLSILRRYPAGLERKALAASLGVPDRRMRRIVAAVREAATAPVIARDNVEGKRVYKLASTDAEVAHAARELRSRARHLEDAADGIERAYHQGPKQMQDGIFDAA